ncbi:MAG TPA: hypothetical protein VGO57_17000 [Verrucomicrobiae bacterium]
MTAPQSLCGMAGYWTFPFRRLTLRSATTLAAAQPKPPTNYGLQYT